MDVAEEILVLGLEAGARGFVERESEELAVVEDPGAAVTPSDVDVLVEVGGGGGRHEE